MKIGLWNIDHPETASGSKRKQTRFEQISDYLALANCDAYIITEANAAMTLHDYSCALSVESPFKSSRRFYGSPNIYHQVAIYSKEPIDRSEVFDPINGLQTTVGNNDHSLVLYGNVITIKDQWSKTSDFNYNDRLNQQIEAIRNLPRERTLVAGDFNLRLGWPQKLSAHNSIKAELGADGWSWPTEERQDTVQHVLHTRDLNVDLRFDFSVKHDKGRANGLSDHPFVEISTSSANKANT
ncbi:endonuclease/exonuclease/phosphatase family protein [Haloferula sp.]|uniref:endonuclease/exonuclease/phosphatase family protein n=1 Tax=Haloferula sp. TaxID=2497595 RepID=UPI0032A014E0